MIGKIQTLQQRFSKHFGPNVVYVADYLQLDPCMLLQRYQVLQVAADKFDVQRISSDTLGQTLAKSQWLGSRRSLLSAKTVISQEGVALEQNGYDFYEDSHFPLFDVTETALAFSTYKAVKATELFNLCHSDVSDLVSQPITGGIHAMIKIGSTGAIHVCSASSAGRCIELGDSSVKVQLEPLMRIIGFRGAILEVLVCNHKLAILDATYFADRWLHELSFAQRISFLISTLKKNGLDDSLVVRPIATTADSWLAVNNNGRAKGFLVRNTKARPNAVPTGSLVAAHNEVRFIACQSGPIYVSLIKALHKKTNVLCAKTLKYMFSLSFPDYLDLDFTSAALMGPSLDGRYPIIIQQPAVGD